MRFDEENIKKYNFIPMADNKFRSLLNGMSYRYHYVCLECGYPHLNRKVVSNFCCHKCTRINENHKMVGSLNPMFGKTGEKSPTFGRKHSVESRCLISENHADVSNEKNPNWRGGYISRDLPRYDLYAPQLEPIEKCVRDPEDPALLNVFCTYNGCKKQFRPARREVKGRLNGINSGRDWNRFYCSPECKHICPLFKQTAENLMKADAIAAGRITLKNLRNEVPKWIRDKVLELDDHTCQMCGSKDKLHVHHEIPQKRNQMMVADIENCVSVCIPCHVWVHTQIDGCRYHELANLELC
ncbi:MAG: HNH endonuclease [Candidatus Shapirobacteria bacterium]